MLNKHMKLSSVWEQDRFSDLWYTSLGPLSPFMIFFQSQNHSCSKYLIYKLTIWGYNSDTGLSIFIFGSYFTFHLCK